MKLIPAPSNLGLKPPKPDHEPGVRRMAGQLLSMGLADRLGAPLVELEEPPAYSFECDHEIGVRNAAAGAGAHRQ